MRKFSTDEKKEILEDFLLSQASGESVESVCERRGVARTMLYYWKGILDRGGSLEDIMAEPDPPAPAPEPAAEPEPEPAPVAPAAAPQPAAPSQEVPMPRTGNGKRTDITDTSKVAAVKRVLSGKATIAEASKDFGVSWGSVDNWITKYKQGGFGTPDPRLVGATPPRGSAGGRPRTKPRDTPAVDASDPRQENLPMPRTKSKQPPPPPPRTDIVTFRDPATVPVQLGLALTEADHITLLRAENARLKAKIRQLVAMVVEDE